MLIKVLAISVFAGVCYAVSGEDVEVATSMALLPATALFAMLIFLRDD